MHAQADDIAVIQLVLQDSTAYATLVERYQAYVFTLVMRYVNNREVAEELSQDVFVKAYRYLADFKGNSKFSTWLYTIVNSTCLSHMRKKQNSTILLEEEQIISISDSGHNENSLAYIEQKAQKRAIENAMKQLPEQDAQLLTLFYLAEQSVEEIGVILGMTAGNVKVRLFRARQKMKTNLTAETQRRKA